MLPRTGSPGLTVDKHQLNRGSGPCNTMLDQLSLCPSGAALLGFLLSVTALTATMVMLGSLAA